MPKTIEEQCADLYYEREAINKRRAVLLAEHSAMDIEDYELTAWDGSTVMLSETFGEHDKLVLVHNMGKHCPYCTLWADGFIGIWKHFGTGQYGEKMAFVLLNNDPAEEQRAFAESRGWEFPMLSAKGTTVFRDLGFEIEQEGRAMYLPGVSSITKDPNGRLRRVTRDFFGPGDMFCSLFHFFDLFPDAEEAGGDGEPSECNCSCDC